MMASFPYNKKEWVFCFLLLFFSFFCDDSSSLASVPTSRRRFFTASLGSSTFLAVVEATPAGANNPSNPLTLRGQYWETGKLVYTRAADMARLAEESDETLLRSLSDGLVALRGLDGLAEDGRYDALTAALRGGAISETTIRTSARILLDREEDDARETRAQEAYSRFTTSFDVLDQGVVTAARKAPGGLTGTLGMAVISPFQAAGEVARVASSTAGDDRIEVLNALGAAVTALSELVRILDAGVAARRQPAAAGPAAAGPAASPPGTPAESG